MHADDAIAAIQVSNETKDAPGARLLMIKRDVRYVVFFD